MSWLKIRTPKRTIPQPTALGALIDQDAGKEANRILWRLVGQNPQSYEPKFEEDGVTPKQVNGKNVFTPIFKIQASLGFESEVDGNGNTTLEERGRPINLTLSQIAVENLMGAHGKEDKQKTSDNQLKPKLGNGYDAE